MRFEMAIFFVDRVGPSPPLPFKQPRGVRRLISMGSVAATKGGATCNEVANGL